MSETPQEIGSRTAKGGFENERKIRDLLKNWKSQSDAKNILKSMGVEIENIKTLDAKILGGRKKVDLQIFITYESGNTQTINLSLKKQDRHGFNHIDRRTVDFYADKFQFSETTRIALKKFCGVPGFSPLDLLKSGELTKEEYFKLRDIPEKKHHTEPEAQGGRFYIDELSPKEQKAIIKDFEDKKEKIIHFILNGDDPEYPVHYLLITKQENDQTFYYIESLKTAEKRANGKIFLTKSRRKDIGANLQIGDILIQRKGGTGGATQLQFKWKNIFPE
ncbi:MAG: hypothetical protein ACTSRP_16860 [Candidatus Helarchaeota archaeon]